MYSQSVLEKMGSSLGVVLLISDSVTWLTGLLKSLKFLLVLSSAIAKSAW